ncbi:MAG: CoA transferase [Deltaproteobacteria bacterium]|nr:CoA transferase [Deltaproteobacteria bacterium]
MQENNHKERGLLAGVRILELASVVAGPFAASMLADFGAEVIKVELPGQGDAIRYSGVRKNDVSLWWKVSGRNKKNITLDLRHPKGQEICKKIVAQSDALIENFRPGTLEKWNLGWEDLQRINPSLIMLRISGYGQTGPYSPRPGFGKAAEAMSGVMQITGYPDEQPISPGFSFADTVSGLMGAFAVMTALHHRDGLGARKGQLIDVALFESIYRLIEWQVIFFDQLGVIPTRRGAKMGLPGSSWLINNYPTKDGKWVAVSASNRQVLNRVLKLIGGENLLADERFNGEQVFRHMDELDVITADWIRERECKDVIQSFVDAGAVAAPVYDIRDIFHDEQYAARDDILEMEDEELGRIRMLGVIPKFPQRPGQIRWTGKEMGFFNREIYCDLLGMSLEELASLKAEGIV